MRSTFEERVSQKRNGARMVESALILWEVEFGYFLNDFGELVRIFARNGDRKG